MDTHSALWICHWIPFRFQNIMVRTIRWPDGPTLRAPDWTALGNKGSKSVNELLGLRVLRWSSAMLGLSRSAHQSGQVGVNGRGDRNEEGVGECSAARKGTAMAFGTYTDQYIRWEKGVYKTHCTRACLSALLTRACCSAGIKSLQRRSMFVQKTRQLGGRETHLHLLQLKWHETELKPRHCPSKQYTDLQRTVGNSLNQNPNRWP